MLITSLDVTIFEKVLALQNFIAALFYYKSCFKGDKAKNKQRLPCSIHTVVLKVKG
jgi:hypothetical protein